MCVKRFWQETLKFSEKDGVKKMGGEGGLIVERFYWRKKMKKEKLEGCLAPPRHNDVWGEGKS